MSSLEYEKKTIGFSTDLTIPVNFDIDQQFSISIIGYRKIINIDTPPILVIITLKNYTFAVYVREKYLYGTPGVYSR